MATTKIRGFATVLVIGNLGGAAKYLSGGSIRSVNCKADLEPNATGVGLSLGGFSVSFPCRGPRDDPSIDCEFDNGDIVRVRHAGFFISRTKVSWYLQGCRDSTSFWNIGTFGYVTGKWEVINTRLH